MAPQVSVHLRYSSWALEAGTGDGPYLASGDPAKKFNSKFTSAMSAGDATKHRSGVLYLMDDSIMAKTPNDVNVKASYLWNPSALRPLAGSQLEANLKARGAFDLR